MIDRGSPSPYRPVPDLLEANQAWGANCGPASIAALLGMTLADLRPHLGDFERRRYMNPSQAKAVLLALGLRPRPTNLLEGWPPDGLIFVQFKGQWDGAPAFVQYQHTHWIAVRGSWVYEVNNNEWSARWFWKQHVIEEIALRHDGASGGWYARSGYAVDLPRPPA